MTPRQKPKHLEILKLAQENPTITSVEMGRRLGVRPGTVVLHLHRCGFFKVWKKVQMPTNEGLRIR